jgi:alkylation response protein AidB-like acyl-CoA dehydrogenase
MSADTRPGLSAEQAEIGRTVAAFIATHSPESEVRRLLDTERGFDDGVWAQLAELGVPGLTIAEEHGGLGLGIAELSLVMEAAGGALLCAPLLSSAVLGTALIQRAADKAAQADLLPALASGARRAAVALGAAAQGGVDPVPTATASHGAAGWQVSGTCQFVLDGHTADDILVAATGPGGLRIFAVDAAAPGVRRTPMDTLDRTRKQAVLSFAAAPARPLSGAGPDVIAAIGDVLDVARVLLAAEQVGGADACLHAAVEYAKTRIQFGRVIGSFQAVKHTCANMLVTLEGARAAMLDAVRIAASGGGDLALAASLGTIACSDAFASIASDALHVHGGIGYTWDHPSHLYFRRAMSSRLMFGGPGPHRARLLAAAGLGRPDRASTT